MSEMIHLYNAHTIFHSIGGHLRTQKTSKLNSVVPAEVRNVVSGVETGGSGGSLNRGSRAPEGSERGDTKNKARKKIIGLLTEKTDNKVRKRCDF